MTIFVAAIITALTVNAVLAFGVAFFWHAKVLFTLYRVSDNKNSHVPWKALGNQKSTLNRFGQFVAGELLPEMRHKWGRALRYLAMSFVSLFLVAGGVQVFAPAYLQ